MERYELYRIAISAELASQKLYTALARSFQNPETAAFFTELVTLEKTHEEKLRRAFEDEYPGRKLGQVEAMKHQLDDLDFSDPQALLDYAISREDAARDHYLAFAAETQDGQMKQMLLRFAEEEEGHKTLLQTETQRLLGALQWFDPSELAGFMDD